ncbi:BURP domain-containing protein 3 [Acorus calamus]|uniref:BURP domain-containing protein 3 n=1 Tax=Acorus calamus TaxID=4465 RepID=A0AAV9F778_ACOCL|nr:BURP domain-containing protein 3 [Acorus calamus]
MDSKFTVPLILLLSIVAAARVPLSSSDRSPFAAEAHWKTVLPDTAMPVVINELLHPSKEGRSTGNIIVDSGSNQNYQYVKLNFRREIPDATLFFLEDDLKRPGTRMHIQLTKRMSDSAVFLPQSEAKSIPFSTADLPNTLSRFSIQPKSKLALLMQQTLLQCEAPPLRSEVKHCATSLESIVDFTVNELGTNKGVQAMTTVLEDRTAAPENSPYKWYTVAGTAKEVSDAKTKTVNCHPVTYAYVSYYCHSLARTRTYVVPFVGDDGTKAEAMVVCHTDTSRWDPNHISFQMLRGVKPGTVPICHTLAEDTLVWMTS